MTRALITQDFIDRLAPGEPVTIRDTRLAGFLVVVNRKSISFCVQRDLWADRRLIKTCRVTLGRAGIMTVKSARAEAQRVLGLIAAGIDPNQRESPEATLAEAFGEYLDRCSKLERAPKTVAMYRYEFGRYLAPLHKRTLSSIGTEPVEVRRLHDRITRGNGPYAANRAMSLLRAVYRHARRADARLPEDPVSRVITFNREHRRNHGMGPADLREWWAAVDRMPNPVRRAFHKVCLLTGARPGSVAALRWADIDLDRATVHFAEAKGRPYSVPLASMTAELLKELPRLSLVWVFTADSRSGHIAEWKESGLMTGHALRHCYRGILAQCGVGGLEGRVLMGHSVHQDIHDGYLDIRVMTGRLAEAAERVAAWVERATCGRT